MYVMLMSLVGRLCDDTYFGTFTRNKRDKQYNVMLHLVVIIIIINITIDDIELHILPDPTLPEPEEQEINA